MNDITALGNALNVGWILLGAALVFFMQAGFAMVETGFTRAKNAGNIIMKNLMDFSLGTPIFWIFGFGLMFGGTGALIGGIDLFTTGGDGGWATLIFQTVFCATAATIVSGSMAERTKFSAYCIYSMLISAIVYPISGHWIWGGGWLAQLGFHDFAGSCAVHMVGGTAAFIGAKILGPRIGKYTKDGKARAIPGHSLTLGALGVFILWFCWFGFNGCSTVALTDGAADVAARVFVTTNLAAAVATVTVMCITWVRYKKPDVSMTLNGSLAGLVAITAGCDAVTPVGAAIIGIIAGFVVVFGIEFVDQKLKVDDPVGAVGVHGLCGLTGTLLTGVFAYYLTDDLGQPLGLLYGGGVHFLGVQVLGIVSVLAWVGVTMVIIFQAIKHTIGLRVTEAEEISGLDLPEHGLTSAYADFMPVPTTVLGTRAGEAAALANQTAAPAAAVPVTRVQTEHADGKPTAIHKVVIITNQSRFEALKNAMNEIGVTGMTVIQAAGCGMQKGAPEYYRGVPVEATLLPKVKLELVVSAVPVETVVEAARRALYTGHIGDGKIFVFDVSRVIRIRTGEEDDAAI